jgi:alkanesulfonate monooxygenase SsuD/methylene tetrahydromethanopterin reductase-like flavin-dependent oxidoreductase (luciferase family)
MAKKTSAKHATHRTAKTATKALHDGEAALARKDNAQARALLREARDLIAAMPITEAQARAPEIVGAFTGAKEKGARQAELEQQWASFAKANFEQARASGTLVIGSPDTVAEIFRAQAARCGHNYLVLLLAFGSLTHEEQMRSLALFRAEVMPKLAPLNEAH